MNMMSIKRLFTRIPVLSRVYGRNQYRSFSPLSQMDPRQNKWIGIASLSVLGSFGYGVWAKQRDDTFIDDSIKKGIAKEMEKRKLSAKEEFKWEQLKFHIEKSYVDIRQPDIYIDRPLLHLKLAQSISSNTVASGKPKVVIIETEKGLGKSIAFRKAGKLFAESLNDPSKNINPSLIIPPWTRSINTYVLYLNLQKGLTSALNNIDIEVKDDLEALRAISRCFADAEKNKYRIVLLLDAPEGIVRNSLFRGVCKDIIESHGYIYVVATPQGVAAFEGGELDKSRKKIMKNDDWFRATEHQQKMMIDGFIHRAKEKSKETLKFVVKDDKSYPNDGVVSKAYNTMKDEEAFKKQNLGDIADFLSDRYPIV